MIVVVFAVGATATVAICFVVILWLLRLAAPAFFPSFFPPQP
jgi:hypothetical protein